MQEQPDTLAITGTTPQKSADIPGSHIQPQYVNRFQVVAAGDHVRFIFGDATIGLDATYHSAIVMSLADAIALSDLLMQIAKSQQSALSSSQAAIASQQATLTTGIADTKKPT
jgi:hypothetical protein